MTDKICLAPWTHLHTWPNNSVYPCCLAPMENPVGNLKNQTLEEVWNSQELKDIWEHRSIQNMQKIMQ